jgi:hypothetical protein
MGEREGGELMNDENGQAPDSGDRDDSHQKFESLVARFRALGVEDPEGWALSEGKRNMAQLAALTFLHGIWPSLIDTWWDRDWIDRWIRDARAYGTAAFTDAGHGLDRLLAAGASHEDLMSIMRAVAYEVAFGMLVRLDDGRDTELTNDYPHWALMEMDAQGELTGRVLESLHESLLSMDPSGREGVPE